MWCIAQANWRLRHFPESATKSMVPVLLHDILEHVGSKEIEVRNAGLFTLSIFVNFYALQLREAAATEVLSLLKHVRHSPEFSNTWTWNPLKMATNCLSGSCQFLNTAQRQECVALIASYFEFKLDWETQLEVMSELRIFWRADANPSKTYAATVPQLLELQRSASVHPYVRSELFFLLLV